MITYAPNPARRARMCAAVIACALTLGVASPAVALAQSPSLVVVKTLGAGSAGEPADTHARFQAVLLEGLGPDPNRDLGRLATEQPALLTANPGYALGPAHYADTDESGRASFYGLEPGVYQVSQVAQTAGNTYRGFAAPALIRVDGGTALARAKNQPTIIEKTPLTDTAVPGGEVTFAITTTVPPCDANGELHQFVVVDELEPRLALSGIRNVRISNVDGTVALREGEDFSAGADGNRVEFSLNKSGLARLAAARDGNPETRVHFDIATTVARDAAASTPGGADPIVNTAHFSPDGYCVPRATDSVIQVRGDRVRLVAEEVPTPLDCQEGVQPEPSETAVVALRPAGAGADGSTPWWSLAGLAALLGWGTVADDEPHSTAPDSDSDSAAGALGDAPQPSLTARVVDSLAGTGASVLGLLMAGVTLVALAVVLISRRREEDQR